MNRQERLKKVFYYLRSQGLVHTQKDLADAIETTPPNMSKAMHGEPSVLTDSFCKRIQKHFKMISADWLITGEGEMIVNINSNDSNQTTTLQPSMPDYGSLINATIAAMDSTIASLKRELTDKELSTKAMLDAKDEAIASLKRELESKDILVKSLRQQVSELSFALSALKEKSTSGYPFTPMGVAEDGNIAATNKEHKEITAKFPSRR